MDIRKLIFGLIAIVMPLSAQAVSITVDEIIYEGADTDTSVLAGSIDMQLVNGNLVVTLTNTSTAVASADAASNLLTGLGFNLPTGVFIGSGNAAVAAGSNTLGFSGSDVSGEWGYDNSPLDSGPFQRVPEGIAYSDVNTTITTMEASTTSAFNPNPLLSPDGLAGPEFGLLSNNVDAGVAGGLAAIQSSIVFEVALDGLADYLLANPNFDLLAWIESQDVVISFGSPDQSAAAVSESPALIMLGLGILGLTLRARKRA